MIYLDHAAATPLNSKALAAMQPYFSERFYNPSAPYWAAKEVQDAYREAKDAIAHAIGAKAVDLVMTSGATEANALASTVVSEKGEILLAATEHASMQQAAAGRATRSQEQKDRLVIRLQPSGLIDLDDLRSKITEKTELISISLADSELGIIQPLAEVASIVRTERQKRLAAGDRRPLWLHTDASQTLNLMNVNVARLGVDLLTLNAAKVYGPKGVGALYVGRGVKIKPLFVGGGQERGLRGGTENVAGVVGFAAALAEAQEHVSSNRKKYAEWVEILRRKLVEGCKEIVSEWRAKSGNDLDFEKWPMFLGNAKHQLANFCPVSFPGLDAERLVFKLDEKGVLVSTGAACAASKGVRSPVLMALGLDEAAIAGSLRLTLGATNTREEIERAGELILEAVQEEVERLFNDSCYIN